MAGNSCRHGNTPKQNPKSPLLADSGGSDLVPPTAASGDKQPELSLVRTGSRRPRLCQNYFTQRKSSKNANQSNIFLNLGPLTPKHRALMHILFSGWEFLHSLL